jgi:hypothetical protein
MCSDVAHRVYLLDALFVGYWKKALPARLGDQSVRSHSLSLPK